MQVKFLDFVKENYPKDAVIITCGLPATNKTETAEAAAEIKDYKILRTDLIRLEVLKNEDIFDEKVASDMNKRTMVYDEMFRRAGELAASGLGFILDATFIKHSLRLRAADIAAQHAKLLIIQQMCCPENISLERIAGRTKEKYESNALTPQAYFNNADKFEQLDLETYKTAFPDLKILHILVETSSNNPDSWQVINSVKV